MSIRSNPSSALAAALIGLGLLGLAAGPTVAVRLIGAVTFLVGAWVRPIFGSGAVVATLPFYLQSWDLGVGAISSTELTLVLAGIATVARRRHVAPATLGARDRYDGPIALFLLGALLSLLATEYWRLSLHGLRTLIVEPIAFYYLLRLGAPTTRQMLGLIAVLLGVTTAVALLAMIQVPFGGGATDADGIRRVQGWYPSPNHLALLLGRSIPLALAGAIVLKRVRLALSAVAIICSVALAATHSLGGLLGSALAIVTVLLLLIPRQRAVWWIAVLGLCLAGATMLGVGVERVGAGLDPSSATRATRVQLWQASIRMIADYPLLGIGLDNFLYRHPAFVPTGRVLEPNLSHPHNLLLQFWLETGVIGLVGIIWVLGRFGRDAIALARRPADPLSRAVGVGTLASMVDFVVHGMVDNGYFLVDMAFIFWLTVSACALAVTNGGIVTAPRRPEEANQQ